ncbi:MAG TPA: TolC family protein [Verrucomicrobiota bacterium]|nr:TolC family protein [Verrucomicrobiota bacterium]HNT13820.1 TolC family protein [Verrucomicrobiota bacterium]
MRKLLRANLLPGLLLGFSSLVLAPTTAGSATSPEPAAASFQAQRMRLDECVFSALRNNRQLQIERLTPAVAASYLSGAYGYYNPLFTAQFNLAHSQDNGTLDPEDFSREALYDADSQRAYGTITGVLPWGLNYSLTGNYAHSDGTRNFFNFESYGLQAGIEVRQPLLRDFWIDQGRLTIQINKRTLKISELGVRYVAMDVINRTQLAYYELAYAIEAAQTQRDLLATREALLASVKRRVEMGTLTILDQRLAEARVATVATSLAAAENAVHLAENELKTQLGDSWTNSRLTRIEPVDALLAVPQFFDVQASWQQGLAERPDLKQLREDLAKAEIDLKYRRNQLFPALDLVAGYSVRGSDTDKVLPPFQPSGSLGTARRQLTRADMPSDLIGVLFSIPLGSTAERANFRASKQLREQAGLRVKQYEELVMRQISDALHTAKSQLERVQLTRRARELSEAALEAENEKLIGGKSTVFLVLEMQNDLAVARTAEWRAKTDYNQARSQLHFAEASLLDDWRVLIELK